jgi:hypothetical protein
MRKIFLLLVVLFATTVMANEIHWAKDYKSGMAQAQKQNKPVMFISSRHTCKYCVILEKTMQDKAIVDALNKDFISIVSYSDDNDYLPRELWRPGTPAVWFLNPDGTPMYQPLMGAYPKEAILQAIAIVKTEFDKNNKKSGK